MNAPSAARFYPTMKQVEKNYADKMRLVFRQFPLTNMHPRAQKAAEASLCANEQGRFWEFYDALFSDQSRLDVPSLKQRAQTLGLNTTAFNTCLDSGKQAGTILKDRKTPGRRASAGPQQFSSMAAYKPEGLLLRFRKSSKTS